MRSLPILVVLVLAVACGGSSKQEAGKPAPPSDPVVVAGEGAESDGPDGKDSDADELSKEDCEAVLDHVSQLFIDAGKPEMADEMKNARDEAITQCMATGTRAEYDCFIAAKVMDDLVKCGG